MEGKSMGYDIKLLVGKPDEELLCVICLSIIKRFIKGSNGVLKM